MKYGKISIERFKHDSFKIKGSKIVYIDPFRMESVKEKADIVFLTHDHFDHCSPEGITKVASSKTILIATSACKDKVSDLDLERIIFVQPGEEFEVLGIQVKTVPAYNIDKWRSPGVPYHPKESKMVGYLITIDGTTIYHAGDTDNIPEMDSLGEVDIALLPVSGTYVMTAKEAAEACERINPKLVIPMHYDTELVGSPKDAEEFKENVLCKVEII